MRPGSLAWWLGKIRQTRRHVFARVSARERDSLGTWLSPAQLALFDEMHIADRRHGLDVIAVLRAEGMTDPELLVAGLLHDCAKGNAGLSARVLVSLEQAHLGWPARAAAALPRTRRTLQRLRDHAALSAGLAAAAGCSERTVELIRWQDAPRDPIVGERLRLADEAS
ncbi:MAG TPA: hypothetical protein VJ850_09460 [Candidatus Limnocylindrales bacterium]|nr:hypothetical protein [Candidatus Limnocylindrales bacterium]